MNIGCLQGRVQKYILGGGEKINFWLMGKVIDFFLSPWRGGEEKSS